MTQVPATLGFQQAEDARGGRGRQNEGYDVSCDVEAGEKGQGVRGGDARANGCHAGEEVSDEEEGQEDAGEEEEEEEEGEEEKEEE